MKSEDKTVVDFIKHCDGQLVLPVYQRDFVWEYDQYSQLFNDILESKNRHWIDRIVIKEFKTQNWLSGQYFEIHLIDGQQRITSILTLCAAICAWCNNHNFNKIDWKNQIYNKLLKTDFDGKLKLKLRGDNDRIFQEIVTKLPFRGGVKAKKTNKGSNNTNKLLAMYNYFYTQINPENVCILFDNIRKLETIEVICQEDDDGQKVFHSINYYGTPLRTYEVIRNLSLMNKEIDIQEMLDKKYWNQLINFFTIEKNRKSQFETFFEMLGKYIRGETTKVLLVKDTPAFFIKAFFEDGKYNEFFEKLTQSFELYLTFKGKKIHPDETIRQLLDDFSRFGVDSSLYPILFKLFEIYNNGKTDKEDLINALYLLRTHIIRSNIAGEYSPQDILTINLGDITSDLTYSLFAALTKRTTKVSDAIFKERIIQSKNWYKANTRKITKFVLEEIENSYHSKERIDFKNAQIEHIMPQKLSDEWKQELGKDHEMILSTYLNKLGNLTIAPYNQKLSNELFSEKKCMADGFNDDRNYLSRYICKFEVWDQYSIEQRTVYLADKMCELFKYPDTNTLLDNSSKQSVLMSAK